MIGDWVLGVKFEDFGVQLRMSEPLVTNRVRTSGHPEQRLSRQLVSTPAGCRDAGAVFHFSFPINVLEGCLGRGDVV
jgi:hypothetical protein